MNPQLVRKLGTILQRQNLTISVAESCTGGNLSAALTSVSGASNYFNCGFITYANQAKINLLGVEPAALAQFGAVSEKTALAMVIGVHKRSNSQVCIAVTGIAGPHGGSAQKPVGTVCFGFLILGKSWTTTKLFAGDRVDVVTSSVNFALKTAYDLLNSTADFPSK